MKKFLQSPFSKRKFHFAVLNLSAVCSKRFSLSRRLKILNQNSKLKTFNDIARVQIYKN